MKIAILCAGILLAYAANANGRDPNEIKQKVPDGAVWFLVIDKKLVIQRPYSYEADCKMAAKYTNYTECVPQW